jgi:hypothetical protein
VEIGEDGSFCQIDSQIDSEVNCTTLGKPPLFNPRFTYDEGYTPDVLTDDGGAVSRGYGRMTYKGTGRIKVRRRKDLNMNIKILGAPEREWDL